MKNHQITELLSMYQFAEDEKSLKRLMMLFSLLQCSRQT